MTRCVHVSYSLLLELSLIFGFLNFFSTCFVCFLVILASLSLVISMVVVGFVCVSVIVSHSFHRHLQPLS